MSYQGRKINPTRFHPSQIKFYVILIPMAIFMVIPIIYLFTTAFKPQEELFKFPPSILVYKPTWKNFQDLFALFETSSVPASRYLFNSILVTVLTVVVSVTLSVSAGYILSKKKFKGRGLLFEINTLALMFVPIAVTIPRFIIIVNMGLIDNFFSNILPIIAMPVGLFLIKQFIDQIPDSLIEAARIDGAGEWTILFRVVMPMIKPALATVAILSFQSAWGATEASVYFLNDESLKTFAYYIATFTASSNAATQGVAAASALIMFLPNLIIFIVMQSQVMDTMAHSGIK